MRSFVISASCLVQVTLVGSLASQAPPAWHNPAVRRVADTLVVLSDGAEWAPGLFKIRYHGYIMGTGGSFTIISGFECTDCDAPRLIHVLRPLVSAADTSHPAFYFPGTVGSEDNPEGFIRSRGFVGSCTASDEQGLVIVESRRGDDGRWADSTRTVRLMGGKLVVDTQAGRVSAEQLARQRVSAGRCHEIVPEAHQLEG